MSSHKWQFSPRFRSKAFGWKSDLPIKRIKEALTEIRSVSRHDPILAADGAVIFLEKLAPSLEAVDSSSGAIGTAVNKAIETLVPIISQAPASDKQRQQWLERLWDALQNDQMPYIEYLGDFWGELCATPAIASSWVDRFIDLIRHIWSIRIPGQFHFFSGITPCLSALYAAKRYDELLDLLKGAPSKYWRHRHWGVKALLALEKPEEALKYIDDSKGLNAPTIRMACESEAILLSMGLADEAYERYAFEANMKPTHLATFRALTKKYPNKEPLHILQDLIDSQPGNEGKWFAAAKDAGFYDLAVKLVLEHPADPRTLARATKEFSEKNPPFAIACGMAGLRWIIEGYGYEISGSDVYEAYYGILQAAKALGLPPEAIKKDILALFIQEKPCTRFVKNILQRDLGE